MLPNPPLQRPNAIPIRTTAFDAATPRACRPRLLAAVLRSHATLALDGQAREAATESSREYQRLSRLGLILLLWSACWGYPIIDIRFAFANGGGFQVSAAKCAWFHGTPAVQSIVIRRADEGRHVDGPVLCGLKITDQSGNWPELSDWTYGQPRDGFKLIGSCEPLEPGAYRVDVHGAGAGSRLITLGPNGQWAEESPHCSP